MTVHKLNNIKHGVVCWPFCGF